MKSEEVLQKIIEFKKEDNYEGFKEFIESIGDLYLLELWDTPIKLMKIIYKSLFE
jgi:hypothetical protein